MVLGRSPRAPFAVSMGMAQSTDSETGVFEDVHRHSVRVPSIPGEHFAPLGDRRTVKRSVVGGSDGSDALSSRRSSLAYLPLDAAL